jgi:site-specific DNA recombinase
VVSKQSTNGSICGSYARHDKKACSAYTIKEDFLKEKILCDIRSLLQEIDKEQYLKELEVKLKKAKKDLRQKLDRINKQIDLLKVRKQNFIKMMADEKIRHDEYLEMVEDNNIELNQLLEKKIEMFSLLEKEEVIDNIVNLKKLTSSIS